MFLLDTNSLSETRRLRPDPAVAAWFREQDTAAFFTSVIVLTELERGIRLIERRDRRQGAILRRWLDVQVPEWFGDRVLDVDEEVARCAGALHVPDPAPEHDALIGATALVRELTVVTRNVRDFERFGVPVINPWEAS